VCKDKDILILKKIAKFLCDSKKEYKISSALSSRKEENQNLY